MEDLQSSTNLPDVWLQIIAAIGVWLFGEIQPDFLVKSTELARLFGEIETD